MSIKVVHYINQFYGGIGGEDKATYAPTKVSGIKGPGIGLNPLLGEDMEIVSTIICGDSYYNENMDKAREEVFALIESEKPDLFVCGPGFNAGRYGVACGDIGKTVKDRLGIPVVSGLYIENPGADMYKKDIYIVETGNSAASMKDALSNIASLGKKLVKGEEILGPKEDKYIERGVRVNVFKEDRGAKRAVNLLVKKLEEADFETEYPMPVFDRVAPADAVKDVKKCKIALVSSGGPVPKGNPDHIESSSASKYGKYSIKGIDGFDSSNGETAHGGYDPVYANLDLDRVLPLDVLREMEKKGEIGSLHDFYYSTVGNGTSVNSSKAFAHEIALDLKENGVDAVILTST